jgi:RasGEF N-terminal motif
MSADIHYDEVDGAKVVVGATLEKLIEKVASNEIPDKEFVEIFLITHTYFVDSFTLLENLSSKYLKSASAQDSQDRESLFIQMRLINVLKKWLQLGWLKYFAPNPELLSKLEVVRVCVNQRRVK